MSKGTPKKKGPVPMEVDDSDISEDEEGGRRVMGIYIPPPIEPHCSTESKGPRLIITKIVNYDFKSYANEVVLGPFHHQFSAIIGPNGSGKSNVIDAMLFVFGYRAQKIRSKKISVLLHNSNAKPNVTSCKVEVHFEQIKDNPDGTYETLPNTKLIVARCAFVDNSSYYLINGKKATFKDVAKLLKSFGIDLDHNRFLILQGEVESIAMMKAKAATENECGLLEYLEDIIGTTRYKRPLFQINEMVEQLNEKRTEKHNRVKLAEREMKDLEKPMTEAIDYLKAENAFFRAMNLKIQKYLKDTKSQIADAEKKKSECTQELEEHDKQFEAYKQDRKDKEKIIEENTKKKEDLIKRKESMENAVKVAQRKYDETQEAMVATNKRRKLMMAQLKKDEEKLEELKKVPEKNEREIKESEQQIEKLSKPLAENEAQLQKNLASFKDETKELQQKKEALQTKLTDLRAKSESDKAAVDLKESELQIATSERTSEVRKFETFKSSLEDSKKSLEEKKQRIVVAKKEYAESKSKLEDITQECNSKKQKEKQLTERGKILRHKIDESKREMQMKHTHGRVLDFLMDQKKKGKILGVIGRLGDLGGIDSKYDVAISNSTGRLDNILVDTVQTAQTCIEALRTHNVGTATFIALDKMEKFRGQASQKISTPENVYRLFDLIRVEDERVLPAFYFAVRDTLVANDLTQGTRIAYGARRWRVVTLQGAVIETTGTMTGGGRSVLRGKMGQQVQTKTKGQTPKSNKELEGMMVEAETCQNELNHLQQELGELESQIRPLQNKIKQLEFEIRQLEVDIKSLADQIPKMEDQLKRQKEKVENTRLDEATVKALEKEIAALKKTYEQSSSVSSEIQVEIDGVSKQIQDINNKKIKGVREKIKDLQKQIDKFTTNVNKLRAEISGSERNVEKMEDKIENTRVEIKTAEENIKKYDAIRKECTADQETINEKLAEISEELSKADEGFGDLKKEIAALHKKENEGKMKRLEIEQKLEEISTSIADLAKVIPHWEAKKKPLQLHQIPNEPEPEPLKQYTDEELDTYTTSDIQYKITEQEEKLKNKPNLSVIQQFEERRVVYQERVRDLEDVTTKRNEMRQTYDDVRKLRFNEFMQGFNIITKKLKEMYQMITLGGDAELELVDSMDPFNEGVVFSVRPPKKSWKQISNLSGGEKTLSSLALVFALHYYKPSPLYVMDEIDAALDFKNVSIVANYIKERTKNAQFIIISLRSNMFELSEYLVGICKSKDCTNSVTIKNHPPPRQAMGYTQTQPMSTQATFIENNTAFDALRNESNAQPTNGNVTVNPTENIEMILESNETQTESHANSSLAESTNESVQQPILMEN